MSASRPRSCTSHPLGVETYATPGQRYLVYGRGYHPPDIVMASPGIGAIEIDAASADLAFLEELEPGVNGGTISGVVQLKDVTYDRTTRGVTTLGRILVRITNARHATEVVTDEDGRFSVSLPAGTYQLTPHLSDDLVVLDSTGRINATVTDGGCTEITIDTLFNGAVRGVLRGPDGQPLTSTSVDLLPMDIEQDPRTGQIKGTGSVATNTKGEFEFTGRPAGRYFSGSACTTRRIRTGPSYPRTYYPGTLDRSAAMPIIVERGHATEGFDFFVPMILPKGELEVIVDSDGAGELKLCYVQLEDLFSRWSSYTPQRGIAQRFPVVDGQRYEVHAHLEFPDGHLESEPFVFTATAGKTVVTLHPDAPRRLHR